MRQALDVVHIPYPNKFRHFADDMPTSEEKLPDSELAMKLQELTLPLTTSLDGVFRKVEGTTVMRFEREQLFRRG